MTDSLKFGPEWLRNLAGDGCNTGGGGGGIGLTPQRYQLAEHRYGREEMLALFNRTYKPPEPLTGLTGLYVPSTQLPLALTEMTEDESRLWTGGVSTSIGRGRGGSVDRGGRGRTGRVVPHYRGVGGFDEIGDPPRIESQPYPTRTRAFDRQPNERVWSERNGVDPIEWNGSTSPRKELNRGASGSSLMESNWRRHRGGEEDDGWRMQERNARGEKWVKSSWRDAEKERGERVDIDEEKRGDRWDHKGNNRAFDPHPPPIRRGRLNHHEHDNLPEWAVDSMNEGGGSFDAAGAFHGVYSDDEDDLEGERTRRRGPRSRRLSEGSSAIAAIAPGFARSQPPPGNFTAAPGMRLKQQQPPGERPLNGERSKSMHEEKELRRSLSPISSPPGSPNLVRRPAPALEAHQHQVPHTQQLQQSQKREKSKIVEQSKPINSQTSANVSTVKVKSKTDSPKKVDEPNKSKKVTGKLEEVARMDSRKVVDPDRNKTTAQQVSQKVSQQQQRQLATSMASSVIDQSDDKLKSEADNLDRMEEEVAKLIDGEKLPPAPGMLSSSVVGQKMHESASIVQSTSVVLEKWFYRDPQGEVQGPFLASEMAEWHKQGYFATNLLVRRTCDERYTTLGDLINLCGVVPFSPGTKFPPLKISDSLMSPNVPGLSPASLAASAGISKPGIMEDPMLLYQYQQYRLLQNQQLLFKQLRATAITKLSQSDHWQNLSPVEQNQLVLQYMHSIDPEIVDMSQSQPQQVMPNSFMPSMSQSVPSPSNSVLQLFPQLQQAAKTQADTVGHVAPPSPHVVNPAQQLSGSTPIDPIQQLMQQMSGMRNLPPMPQPTPPQPQPPPQEDNPIKSWLRQLGISNGHMQQQQQQAPPQPQLDSVWHQPPPHLSTAFNAQSWMSQVGAIQPTIPPGQISGSLWDIHPKEMKTEQQILEEQNLKIQEEKKKEENRMKEEIERQQAEHDRMKRQQEEELTRMKSLEEAHKKEENERKKRDEEKRRKDEEKRIKDEELRKVEEKKRKEDEKKREEKRKHDEEANRKKQEEEKRKRDELKRQEEKLKKEEEKRKKIEEEQRKQEEEKLRKEEEARKKAEAEEQARKAEQRRREAEALRKLQERSKAPWAQAPPAPPPTAQASLAEIQRLEREKKAEEIRLQQLLQQQRLAQQKAAEAAQEALTDSAKRLQFKWAEKVAPVSTPNQVKSLTQIQQEEQERIAKVKQQERERLEKEKANQLKSAAEIDELLMSSQTYAGFWDDPAPKSNANTVAAKVANTVAKQASKQQQQTAAKALSQQQQQQNNKTAKSKNKKEEELVKKIFEQNTAKTDDFTQWCNKALTGLQVTVDIPTFIGFLRDIEAAYEVKEYIRMYLGDTKQSSEFAKQFLEKRSKWKSAQRPQTQADDLCKPAPAVNPNASTEFQEVKSKSKKPKKGKMYKVDSKMLGFSVMSAPDRINVGDRDYAEGV